ncbi:MAG: RagB/SusD family nutrient uptake outer membrane protein [Massilibacteroides sp.]|nr:RagB/SusD family nutrient uptake outer membrane protein [Massilibacteroides sp.]MDD3061889.1 RagB/SusD family nutrient uptake outer membrane protein [Massilibacteroides sp.]MDD4115591.1 RagB/SusD family nutrient uptake outer membrane protein [Massilibacteroides sp.]MDD4660654.1 RagB/SusD family nutrient uptake outer membrane protein [Massilibacteroides sp.]
MKNYLYFPFLFIIFCLSSCDDLLDLKSNGTITMDEVFTDRNRTRGYLNSCYNYLPTTYLHAGSFTDDAEDSDNTAYSTFDYWYNTGLSASRFQVINFDGGPWSDYFQGIRKCNVFLISIDNATAYATDSEKAGWKAQAYTLRAFYYLQLVKRYGQIPLLLEDYGVSHDYASEKKATVGQIVQQILDDCDSALATPSSADYSWDIRDNQWGIMTKAVAWAIKSQAITYAKSPLFDDGTFTIDKALEITKEALSQFLSNGYELWNEADPENGHNAYATYFLYNPNDMRAKDKETIYGGNQVAVWQNAGLPIIGGVSKAGSCPSQDLVDAYEMANGETPITGYNDANHLKPIINSASGYDENNPYENRDPRFYSTIFYNGSKRGTSSIYTYETGNCGISETNIKYTTTGYYLRKYGDDRSNRNSNYDGYVRIMRLPEIYFNFAEIAYQAKGADEKIDLGGNRSMSACDAVNAVRARAGMPNFPTGLTSDLFEKKYRNERRIEYAMEIDRYFDLRRWKILSEKTQFITGMRITKESDGYTYNRFRFENRPTCEDKYLLYPLTLTEVNKMMTLTGENWQNPGW